MKIKLTPENTAAITKYAKLSGQTPGEFLNEYLQSNMVALSRTSDQVNSKTTFAASNFTPGLMLKRVVAWMEIQVAERSGGRTAFEAETCENKGACWIEAKTVSNGLSYSV